MVQNKCKTIRFSDTGWTETTASTALASEILTALGYDPKVQQLSVPITYASLKNKDIDVFLGNWMPVMAESIRPYLEDHSVELIGTLLKGAKATLAVPTYVYEEGIHSITQLSVHKEQFRGKIFGIEAGSNGNKKINELIKQNTFGLGNWELSESSEQGMLAEVDRSYKNKEWIVFLGWEPHPMNRKFSIHYLNGTDPFFGKNQGGATIHISTRQNYKVDCPQVVKFLKNFTLDNKIENELMEQILDKGVEPRIAAHQWLKSHWKETRSWLTGFKSIQGERAYPIVQKTFDQSATNSKVSVKFQLPKIPVGKWVQTLVLAITQRFEPFFHLLSNSISYTLETVIDFFLSLPPWSLIGFSLFLTLITRKGIKNALWTGTLLVFIWNQGYWNEAIETVVLVVTSTLITVILGTPIGVYCAHHKRMNKVIQPVLDFMQTIPTFVYLIPTLMLFGLGLAPALISTVIFVLPTSIRLTYHGIKSVPIELIETGEAFGATRWQRIKLIEIPYALATIRVGISQVMMLSLSMAVVAALVGAEGLGKAVVQSLSTVNIAEGFEAGFMIVALSILFNRTLGVGQTTSSSVQGEG